MSTFICSHFFLALSLSRQAPSRNDVINVSDMLLLISASCLFPLLSLSLSRQVDQIQAEFKILALQYHPDKNDGDKESEAKFQQLKVRDNDDDKQNDGNDKHL